MRSSVEIKIEMLRKGVSQTAVARWLGCHTTLVNKTINGSRNNEGVLKELARRGIPRKVLGLNQDI